jgi:hypothetical protein
MREKGRKRIEGDGKKGGKRARRARKVTERKMSNKHSLEAGKLYISKGGKGRKVTERKMGNMHFLEAGKDNFKGCGKSEKSDGKKDMQYAFIRSMGGYIKNTTKMGEKWARRRGK